MNQLQDETLNSIFDGYHLNETTLYWVPNGNRPSFPYSDGEEVEQRIHRIVLSASDLRSTSLELRSHITDWPSKYHLSPCRSNLLRPFHNLFQGQVLEVGAGCGAITRFLGECGGQIVAIEGSSIRAATAAVRCRDLNNVRVLVDFFHQLPPKPAFDVVTLIGVLEYARNYFPSSSDDPIDAMLKHAKKFLKPKGILIVAIENQLGLKYFAGFDEDHIGIPMYGIEDQYQEGGVVTFGRKELKSHLVASGLESQRWWYPFPDYKLPTVLLSEAAVSGNFDINFSPLISSALAADPQMPCYPMFFMERAWPAVFRNKLAADMANSFLVMAASAGALHYDNTGLAYHFAVERRREYAKQVVIEKGSDDKVHVRQERLFPEEMPAEATPLKMCLENSSFIHGEHWMDCLKRRMTTSGWTVDHLKAWASIWFDALLGQAGLVQMRGQLYSQHILPGAMLDMIPRNLFVKKDGTFEFIDLEWQLALPVELGFLVFRGIYLSLLSVGKVASPSVGTSQRIVSLFTQIAQSLGVWIVEADLVRYCMFENDIQTWVSESKLPSIEDCLTFQLDVRSPLYFNHAYEDNIAGLNQAVAARDGQITELYQAMAEREENIANLHQAVAARDGQITELYQAMAEREENIANLHQAAVERDGQITSLNQTVAERDSQIHELSKLSVKLDEAYFAIEAMRCSRSWRITAPLRKIVEWLRKVSAAKPRCNLFSRLVIAICILPATFFYYKSFDEWKNAMRRGKSYFGAVLNQPSLCCEPLAKLPRMLGLPVSMLLSVALRIRRNGGVLPSLRNLYRIARKEGRHGVFVRLMEFAAVSVVIAPLPQGHPRILVMDYRIPMPDISAGERATVGILNDLCKFGFDVVLLPNNMTPASGYEEDLRRAGVTVITTANGYQSSNHYLSEQGHSFSAFYLIRVDVAETVIDVIRQVAPHARILFHEPDVYFLREGREAELKDDPILRAKAEATRDRELAIMRRADHTVIVSPAELPVLRQYLPDAPISVFPVLYTPVASHPAPYKDRKDIFFLGGYAHTPNVDAICWFVAEIWPLVHEQLPGVVFHIVGSEAPQTVLDLAVVPGVQVDGFVKDLTPVLSAVRVGVAPLRYGAGIKGKVALTIGAGIPCVCTSIAAEGMGAEDGIHVRVTDDPREFANAVVQIYKDRKQWEQLSSNGRDLVRRYFGSDANRTALLNVLNDAKALPLPLFIEYCRALSPRPMPSLTTDQNVDVSIIIPVYNQWDYTRVCLNSILETCRTVDICYEIILADDGSSDETIRASLHYPGLRVIKTPSNVGFLRNCNHAAEHARGKHILLLNNDTVVLPGWLTALYQLMEEDESATIIGSKLLYPDGTIQEAGGLLLRDGTGYNAGRGHHRNAPLFNIIRETDYVSGASMLIRKSFWSKVGGFDERYKNAYCEDSDLAMTARSKGMRVLYQPASEVIHFEHQSYAEQAPSHDTTLQRYNINILVDKWHGVFERNHLSYAPWHLAMSNAERTAPTATVARRRQGQLNVLYFSPFPSHPSSHGNRATIFQFARHFQEMGHTVHFVLPQSSENNAYKPSDLDDMLEAWDTVDVLPYSNPMLANGDPILFDSWYEEGLGERIRYLCAKYNIDVVFSSYVFQSKLLEFVPAHVLKVIDTHDKMGNRYEMLRANGQPLEFFSCTPEEEGAYLRRADIVVARREEEARYFDSVTGWNTAIVIPHVEDPHFVEKTFSSLRNIGMIASANRINLAITRECLDAIDSRLQGMECPFTIHIAGQVKDMVAALPTRKAKVFWKPWVRMHGFISDIAQFYDDMDVIISPVTMGTGINVKTVQAMAYGMPLLTTVCGGKGIETGDPMHSHENLDALAVSLLSLLTRPDELQRLAAVSRNRYTTFYESSLAAMRRLFSHPKLNTEMLQTDATELDTTQPEDLIKEKTTQV